MVLTVKLKKTLPPLSARERQEECLSTAPGRRWRGGRTATGAIAVVALLISTAAWLSLVFSGSTSTHRRRLMHRHQQLPANPSSEASYHPPVPPHPQLHSMTAGRNRSLGDLNLSQKDLTLGHIVFGIAGSSNLWNRRKEFVRLWWRPSLRGYVWLDDLPPQGAGSGFSDSLPPIMISEDTSRFRYTNPTGHPSGLRISRIVAECYRLGLPNVRWFVLGDDDTIFNVDNLISVLGKYDSSEMMYIGSPSESHSANTYFSHSMAFGGGGIAISYPLARSLSNILDDCLERYPKLYGSDDRLHACISELGVPLTRELGFHQWDIRGSAHGLLTSHPVTPFISIHHLEAVDPFYPGLNSMEGLKLFTKAMRINPRSFLQRAICYDHSRRLTFSISTGYAVQVFPNIVYPLDLEPSELTYSAWNGIHHRNEFDLDMKDAVKSICKKPVLFFLKDIRRDGKATLGYYARHKESNDMRRTVFCFPRSPPLRDVQNIEVLGYPLSKNWHLVPRRLCCSLKQTQSDILKIIVRQCEKGSFTSLVANL
ncbi:hypothetical protein SAY86_000841 [Trapa natans]|uniref:Uncharacterized protein n=1 Tax=Trapa natans TaxID=22666 RepID=A0AAN7RNB5_TRANT|nr:hypothetical protein SAY86_000841 [Trapa natans]